MMYSAERSSSSSVADVDNRVVRLRLAADQFVGLGDLDDLLDAGKVLDARGILRPLMPGDADRRAMRAGNRMRLQSKAFDVPNDCFDLLRRRAGFHDDNHLTSRFRRAPGVVE